MLWFKDYLSDRKQAVVLSGQTSSYQTVEAGVPQGSVLGPTLFLVYINDIVHEIESVIKLFADDTNVYLSLDDPRQRAKILNGDLWLIDEWSRIRKVSFNPIKTKLVNFSRKINEIYEPLTFSGELLSNSTIHKHLGITFQSDCKWNSHLTNLASKCRVLVSVLKSFKYRLSRKSLEIVLKSFIFPQFVYGDVIWVTALKSYQMK